MITIKQLLESVELDFESRWVIKDEDGNICIFEHKPETYEATREWVATVPGCRLESIGKIKLAEFDGKDWHDCIYEAPRKTTGKIEKLPTSAPFGCQGDWREKINELVDAVNELKERTQPITLNPDLTDEDLRKMMRNPKYWRDKDSATIQKVQNGFNKLYGDKN